MTELGIGARIREARIERKITQAAIAKDYGCAQSLISSIENNDNQPGIEFLVWFSRKTGRTLRWLATGEDDQLSEDKQVRETAEGWECKNDGFSESEKRMVGMLRRLTPEMRQVHCDGITTSYFLQMEKEFEEKKK